MMDRDNLIERIARAICAVNQEEDHLVRARLTLEEAVDACWRGYFEDAEAAIAASGIEALESENKRMRDVLEAVAKGGLQLRYIGETREPEKEA